MNELIAFVFALALALTLVSCNKEKSNKKKRLNRGGVIMNKIIEGKRNLLISIVLYCLSISIFLISQLSIVSGTFMSGSVFSYNYPLRVAMNCLAIVCAAVAAFGKTKKLILTVKILLSIFIIAFILIFGMENNAIS